MRNIFLLYMPPTNQEAMTHYRDTIQQKVPLDRIARFVDRAVAGRLNRIFGNRRIAVWGSRDSSANRTKFEKMSEGDDLLIVEGDLIRFMGKVALKTVNADLSRELWHNLRPGTTAGWDLIYFIGNPVEMEVPFKAFCGLLGYKKAFQLRGFSTVSEERVESFYDRYDDLYSVLTRIRTGQAVELKLPIAIEAPAEAPLTEIAAEDVDQVLRSPLVSDHVRMQWKLASLGIKAGEKVWVPSADQGKLRKVYDFNEFEAEFSVGIDLPKNYFENIDVVWKQEFRINAAFEVENSTSIYSGLLRFADLSTVAPNTTYPMFIVAPKERRNRVREQLLRPAFKRLELRGKVQFLPYEAVDEMEKFFGSSSGGMSVDVVRSKAEAIA